MKYYRFPDTKLFKIGFFLFLLTLQMISRSAMIPSAFDIFYPTYFATIDLILVMGILFLAVNRKRIKEVFTDNRMIAVICIVVFLLTVMIAKQDYQAIYISIMLYMLFAVFVNYFMPMQEAAGYYVALMCLLGAWTLVGSFLLKPLVEAGMIACHTFKAINGWSMYNFGLTFTSYLNDAQVETMRAFGVFREPGLFQIFLFIAIQLNNYTVQWKKSWHMWAVNVVLFSALMVTFATGGVLALGLYIVFLFFDKKLYKNKWLCLAAIVSVAVGAVMILTALMKGGVLAVELVGMVEKLFTDNESIRDRVGSIFVNAEHFLNHPIVGEKMSTVVYSIASNTTSSAIMFAGFGVVGGCLHVASWVALAWKKERSMVMNLILMVILFIPFNTQNVVHDMFFWLFPVMALVEKGLPVLLEFVNKRKV